MHQNLPVLPHLRLPAPLVTQAAQLIRLFFPDGINPQQLAEQMLGIVAAWLKINLAAIGSPVVKHREKIGQGREPLKELLPLAVMDGRQNHLAQQLAFAAFCDQEGIEVVVPAQWLGHMMRCAGQAAAAHSLEAVKFMVQAGNGSLWVLGAVAAEKLADESRPAIFLFVEKNVVGGIQAENAIFCLVRRAAGLRLNLMPQVAVKRVIPADMAKILSDAHAVQFVCVIGTEFYPVITFFQHFSNIFLPRRLLFTALKSCNKKTGDKNHPFFQQLWNFSSDRKITQADCGHLIRTFMVLMMQHYYALADQ